ncbi:MAG: response regulator transcription factor [Bacteroidetes bacterium]|nr:response regulator transcription factor [Bacteroidota bacterium]
MKKILIVDDHASIRIGVKSILSNEFQFVDFGEATNAGEATRMLVNEKWDLAILDVDLPGRNGFEILNFIKTEKINTSVLMFTFHNDPHIALRAIKSGAKGFLSKGESEDELIKAVSVILKDNIYLSDSISQHVLGDIGTNKEKQKHQDLSDREYQILKLLSKGQKINQISKNLNLSPSTISTYRRRVLDKLNLDSNADLIYYFINLGLNKTDQNSDL